MLQNLQSFTLPIIELHTMHDQLILAAATKDSVFLYQVLNNQSNVENFVQQFGRSASVINLLFSCVEILDNDQNNQTLITNILRLIYSHCRNMLDHQLTIRIINYIGMDPQELSYSKPNENIGLYYSEGAKRQRLEPSESGSSENSMDHSNTESGFMKKHQSDAREITPLAKRQRCQANAPHQKRKEPLQNSSTVQQSGKKIRY